MRTYINGPATINRPAIRWYVVANRTDAIIYRDGDNHKFQPVEHLLNSEGNKKEKDLDSDRPGKSFSNVPGGTYKHPMVGEHQRHDETVRRFSNRISKTLDAARSRGEFDELVLVAEPHFLGMMKNSLSEPLKKRVAHQLPREFMDTDRHLRSKILEAIRAGVTH